MNEAMNNLIQCHDRILAQMEQLKQIVEEIASSCFPLNPFQANRERLEEFFRFMATRGVLHTRQEEEALFPILLRRFLEAGIRPGETPADVMESEHREAEEILQLQKKRFAELLELKSDRPEDYLSFCALMLELVNRYRRHIWKENNVLFPMADTLLSEEEFEEVWNRMQAAAIGVQIKI
ncbi:MAG: hemerythrin domain-containing protein [Acidobacteria bacterium]|nr:hemerythrin domain-containing protein [Acidobacteriota bacterium]